MPRGKPIDFLPLGPFIESKNEYNWISLSNTINKRRCVLRYSRVFCRHDFGIWEAFQLSKIPHVSGASQKYTPNVENSKIMQKNRALSVLLHFVFELLLLLAHPSIHQHLPSTRQSIQILQTEFPRLGEADYGVSHATHLLHSRKNNDNIWMWHMEMENEWNEN